MRYIVSNKTYYHYINDKRVKRNVQNFVFKLQTIALSILLVFIVSAKTYAEYSIPADELKKEEIFSGDPEKFSNPAEIDMNDLVFATPEYREIKKKKINKGTGKYWILRNRATERCHKVIKQVIKDEKYDLIANEGYLGSLKTPIKCENLTKKALKIIKKG